MGQVRGLRHPLGRRDVLRLGWLGLAASAVRPARAQARGILWDPAAVRERAALAQPYWTSCATFSPDGSLLAVGSHIVPGASPSAITLWETGSWKRRALFEVADCRVHRLAFTPDGKTLVAGSQDRLRIFALDVATGKVRDLYSNDGNGGRFSPFVFSPDGAILATSTADGVTLWEVGTWAKLQDVGGTRDHDYRLASCPVGDDWDLQGGWLRMMDGYGIAQLLIASGQVNPARRPPGDRFARMPQLRLARIRGVARPWAAEHLTFSRDGDTAAFLAHDETDEAHLDIYLARGHDHWEREGVIGLPEPLVSSVYALAFTPDGRSLLSAGGDKLIHSWDVTNGREQPPALKGHTAAIVDLAWSPDGALLASAGAADKTVRIWARPGGR